MTVARTVWVPAMVKGVVRSPWFASDRAWIDCGGPSSIGADAPLPMLVSDTGYSKTFEHSLQNIENFSVNAGAVSESLARGETEVEIPEASADELGRMLVA